MFHICCWAGMLLALFNAFALVFTGWLYVVGNWGINPCVAVPLALLNLWVGYTLAEKADATSN